MVDWLAMALPTYLADVEKQMAANGELDSIKNPDDDMPFVYDPEAALFEQPKGYGVKVDVRGFTDDAFPSISVISPGTAGRPERKGGEYMVPYSLGVVAYIAGSEFGFVDMMASAYASAIQGAILQHASLGRDDVDGIEWEGSFWDRMPGSRQLNYVLVQFTVGVNGVVDIKGGPLSINPDANYRDRLYKTVVNKTLVTTNREA
jgi:hypothetical protein